MKQHDWASVLGRIVIAFGDIEHAAVSLTRAGTSDRFADQVAKLDLKDRLQVLYKLLDHATVSAELAYPWDEVCARVDSLRARFRNAIAHGAPVVDIFESDSGDVRFEVRHASAQKPRESLAFDAVEAAAVDCEQAHLDMVSAATAILQDLALRGLLPLPDVPLPKKRKSCPRATE